MFFSSYSRITESQNNVNWKGLLFTWSYSPPPHPQYREKLNRVAQGHVQLSSEHLRGHPNLPGQPVLTFDHAENFFPNISLECPVLQLVSVTSCPTTAHLPEEPAVSSPYPLIIN